MAFDKHERQQDDKRQGRSDDKLYITTGSRDEERVNDSKNQAGRAVDSNFHKENYRPAGLCHKQR